MQIKFTFSLYMGSNVWNFLFICLVLMITEPYGDFYHYYRHQYTKRGVQIITWAKFIPPNISVRNGGWASAGLYEIFV